MSGRRLRVEQAMRDALAEMIDREVKDPRVRGAGLVTVQRVELNADLSVARIYVSIYGDATTGKRAIAGLVAAAGFLRGPLARRLSLQRPPELRFVRDESPEVVLKLADIVRDDQARAAASGRDGEGAAAAAAASVAATAVSEDEEPDIADESDAPDQGVTDGDPEANR
jgi:ribosome-binding factor A